MCEMLDAHGGNVKRQMDFLDVLIVSLAFLAGGFLGAGFQAGAISDHQIQEVRESLEPIQTPRVAFHAWKDVKQCSGLTPSYGGLNDVKWFSARISAGHIALAGLWLGPDSIVLDPAYIDDSVVVEHELLHYLIGKPGHPRLYF